MSLFMRAGGLQQIADAKLVVMRRDAVISQPPWWDE